MALQLFINLPVRDLKVAMRFYEAVGANNNPQFTDDSAACMVFSDTVHVMLLTHDRWSTFTNKPMADARVSSEVMLAFNRDSRVAVDTTLQSAIAHGGKADINPPQDLGFMYSRSFEDPDGHVWEAFHMAAMPTDGAQAS
jgi:uncharacterized protein